MKIFLYKTLIIFLALFFFYKMTVSATVKTIKSKLNSEENIEILKNKVRKEIVSSLKKDKILNKNDAELINQFIKKIQEELKRTE